MSLPWPMPDHGRLGASQACALRRARLSRFACRGAHRAQNQPTRQRCLRRPPGASLFCPPLSNLGPRPDSLLSRGAGGRGGSRYTRGPFIWKFK